MMRFLEYDFLKDHGLANFDNWVTVFGEQKTEWELAPAGNKFKERTRIANYTGLPELISMFKQVADVRTADTLDLATPEMEITLKILKQRSFRKRLYRSYQTELMMYRAEALIRLLTICSVSHRTAENWDLTQDLLTRHLRIIPIQN